MSQAPQTPPAQASVDAWSLVTSRPSPWPTVLTFAVKDGAGRSGVLRLLERVHAGPDAGRGALEAWQRLQRIDDPRIVRPLGSGVANYAGKEALYVVFPAVDGAPMDELCAEPGSLLAPEVAAAMLQVAEALTATHNLGVTHGDLGPGTLVLRPGRTVAITDFGVCSWPQGSPGPARRLAAPELKRGGPPTFAGDVYALAVLGAGMVCGTAALKGWAAQDTLDTTAVGAALEKAGCSQELSRAILSGLHPDPIARPTATALAGVLRPLAGQLPEIAQVPASDRSGSQPAVQQWLGEESDPRRHGNGSGSALGPAPAPQSAAFLNESTIDNDGPRPITESQILPIVPSSTVAAFPVTESQVVSLTPPPVAPEPPPAPRPGPPPVPPPTSIMSFPSLPAVPPPAPIPTPAGPVAINMGVTTAPARPLQDLPVVARWTERPQGKGRSPVERVVVQAAPAPGSSGSPAGGGTSTARPNPVLIVVALVVGVVVGGLGGRMSAGGGGPHVGAPGTLKVVLPAEVDVETRVELDGRSVGKAPLVLNDVPAGSHVVVLRADGADPSVIPVTVESGATATVSGSAELFSSRLVVSASRKGVTVARGDEAAVAVPAEFDDVEPDSDVKLVFTSGKETITRTVHVSAGEAHFHLEWAGGAGATPDPAPAPAPDAPAPAPDTPRNDAKDDGKDDARDDAKDDAKDDTGRKKPRNKGPDKAQAQAFLTEGKKALVAGQFDQAAVALQKALAADGSLAEAAKNLGIAYARVNKNCEALKYYRRYQDLAPNAGDIDRVKNIIHELEVKAPRCN